MKLLIHLPIQLLDHGPRIYHASMNLPARGPTSTSLPTRSPTLRTVWYIQLRTYPLAAALKCEHKTYEPPRSYPLTRASLIWTTPLILITRSPPIMNLPAHNPVKHLLIQVHISTHQNEIKENTLPYIRYTLKIILGIPMLPRTCPLVVQL